MTRVPRSRLPVQADAYDHLAAPRNLKDRARHRPSVAQRSMQHDLRRDAVIIPRVPLHAISSSPYKPSHAEYGLTAF